MMQMSDGRVRARETKTLKALLGLASVAVLIALAAGLLLLVARPDSGSSLEGALGFTAALAGLATAGFAIAAAVYAQVKNLWQYAPAWTRIAAWAVLGAIIVASLWRSAA
jgi:hypothetical protein